MVGIAPGISIYRKDLCEVGELEGTFEHPFDLEVSKEKFFQDIPARLIKIVRKAQADVDETELQDDIVIRHDLEIGLSNNTIVDRQLPTLKSEGDRNPNVARYDHDIRFERLEAPSFIGLLLKVLTDEIGYHIRKTHLLRPLIEEYHRLFSHQAS